MTDIEHLEEFLEVWWVDGLNIEYVDTTVTLQSECVYSSAMPDQVHL